MLEHAANARDEMAVYYNWHNYYFKARLSFFKFAGRLTKNLVYLLGSSSSSSKSKLAKG